MERPLNVSPDDRHFVMSHSFPFGTGVQILDTTTTKTLHVCAPPSHLCWRNTYTTWGHFTSAIRRKTEIVLQRRTAYALCSEPVHLAAWLEWSCSVWQIRRGKKYLNTMKTKGLVPSKSALCLVQFKSKDNQECLFDNNIYNALFWSPEPPKQRQIGFKQVI